MIISRSKSIDINFFNNIHKHRKYLDICNLNQLYKNKHELNNSDKYVIKFCIKNHIDINYDITKLPYYIIAELIITACKYCNSVFLLNAHNQLSHNHLIILNQCYSRVLLEHVVNADIIERYVPEKYRKKHALKYVADNYPIYINDYLYEHICHYHVVKYLVNKCGLDHEKFDVSSEIMSKYACIDSINFLGGIVNVDIKNIKYFVAKAFELSEISFLRETINNIFPCKYYGLKYNLDDMLHIDIDVHYNYSCMFDYLYDHSKLTNIFLKNMFRCFMKSHNNDFIIYFVNKLSEPLNGIFYIDFSEEINTVKHLYSLTIKNKSINYTMYHDDLKIYNDDMKTYPEINLDTLMYLVNEIKYKISLDDLDILMTRACIHNQLDVVKYLNQVCDLKTYSISYFVLKAININILKYIFYEVNGQREYFINNKIISLDWICNDINVLKFFHKNIGLTKNDINYEMKELIEYCLTNKKVECLKYLCNYMNVTYEDISDIKDNILSIFLMKYDGLKMLHKKGLNLERFQRNKYSLWRHMIKKITPSFYKIKIMKYLHEHIGMTINDFNVDNLLKNNKMVNCYVQLCVMR